jgi:hypothetical protein
MKQWLEARARIVFSLDDCQLAFVYQHFLCLERTEIHSRFVSFIYRDGGLRGPGPALVRILYGLVGVVSGLVYLTVRSGKMGVLIQCSESCDILFT